MPPLNEQRMGMLLETALLRAPLIHIKAQRWSEAINRYRTVLRAMESSASQTLRLTFARQLAEVLLRRVCQVLSPLQALFIDFYSFFFHFAGKLLGCELERAKQLLEIEILHGLELVFPKRSLRGNIFTFAFERGHGGPGCRFESVARFPRAAQGFDAERDCRLRFADCLLHPTWPDRHALRVVGTGSEIFLRRCPHLVAICLFPHSRREIQQSRPSFEGGG